MARESQQARKARAGRIARALARTYPDAKVALRYRTPFELLVATILSAQCTDEKVNEVTAVLFRRYRTPRALADADPEELESVLRPTGFYRQKTKSVLAASRGVVEQFGGKVPRTLDELVQLRGVARKTANLVLGEAYGRPGIAVDTHVKRVSQRLGLTASEDPDKIERDLAELLAEKEWTPFTVRAIHHGRVCCNARKPECAICPLQTECPWPRQRPKKT